MNLRGILAGALLLLASATPGLACGMDTDCAVEGGVYRAHVPANWDGKTPLPVLVFFHGYRGTADGVMRDTGMGELLSARGVLLIAPLGLDDGWSFHGSPQGGRDEAAFVATVLADVRKRWPVDAKRVWASGFSIGGSMTWDLACYAPAGFTAFLPIAGAFWDPLPQRCASGSVVLSHIHGLTDKTVPLEGREIAQKWHQGDVFGSLAVLRATAGCRSNPTSFSRTDVPDAGPLQCREWRDCAGGATLRLCLHPLEHDMRPAWMAAQLDWLDQLAAAPRGAD